MAHILSDETSLDREQKRLARERRNLGWAVKLEAALALACLALFVLHRSPVTAGLAGLLIFLAASHHFKARENRKQEGITGAGRAGEARVSRTLAEQLDNTHYVFNDVLIRQGKLVAQIDHLVICPKGLFVLETKNWSGSLRGDEKEPTWEQLKRGSSQPIRVKNPIIQSRRHAEVLGKFLRGKGIDWPDVFPMLVFLSQRTRFEISRQTLPVLYACDLGSALAHHTAGRVYSEIEIDRVLNLFMGLT